VTRPELGRANISERAELEECIGDYTLIGSGLSPVISELHLSEDVDRGPLHWSAFSGWSLLACEADIVVSPHSAAY
jgi:hypothetical protein